MYYLEMSDFYFFLGWNRLFVDVIRVGRIRSIFFVREIRTRPRVGTLFNFIAICSVDIDAGKQKAIPKLWTQYELQLFTQSDFRCPSPDTRP